MDLCPKRILALLAVCAIISATFAATVLADNENKVWQICVTKIVSHPALDAAEKGFIEGLANSGFVDNKNVSFKRYNAQGELSSADAISQKMAKEQCDLIHTISTPSTQSVLKYIDQTPIVFSAVTDPEQAGIVPVGSVPGSITGTHITGVSDKWPVQLQMQTYAKFVPKAKTWGTIYNPNEDNSIAHVSDMRKVMNKLDLELLEVHAANIDEVKAAAKSLVGKVQAIAITADNTSVANFQSIAEVCNQHGIALFAGDVDSVPKGAIAAYGMDYYLIGYSAGKKAALVLKGIEPGNIPWGLAEKFSFVINKRAAVLQGVTISPSMLRKADKLIE